MFSTIPSNCVSAIALSLNAKDRCMILNSTSDFGLQTLSLTQREVFNLERKQNVHYFLSKQQLRKNRLVMSKLRQN